MKKSGFREAQIVGFLKEFEMGAKVGVPSDWLKNSKGLQEALTEEPLYTEFV